MDNTGRTPQWLRLALCLGLAGLLLGSWFFSPTRAMWNQLDTAVFRLFDASLAWGYPWQVFWAAANNRAADALAALLFLGIFLHYMLSGEKSELGTRLAQGVFTAACTILALDLFSEYVFNFDRPSPTLVLPDALRLSELVPWLPTKDSSGASFPGDHGAALVLFTSFIWFFAGRRHGMVALGVSLFFVWPRLVGGAHWLSDLLVGSSFVSLVTLSLLLATPVHSFAINVLRRLSDPLATWFIRVTGWKGATASRES